MPVRRVRRSWVSSTGSFPSDKNKRVIYYESSIELSLLFFLEFNSMVLSFEEQPFTIRALYYGEESSYTPDILAVRVDGIHVYECKSMKHVEDEETKRQVRIGTEWAEANGAKFFLAIDEVLRQGTELENIKMMWRYRNVEVAIEEINYVRSFIVVNSKVTIGDLRRNKFSKNDQISLPKIFGMLYRKLMFTDLAIPLSNESYLTLIDDKRSTLPWLA